MSVTLADKIKLQVVEVLSFRVQRVLDFIHNLQGLDNFCFVRGIQMIE